MVEPHDGRQPISQPGLSYLPRFISESESAQLIESFGALHAIWERRYEGKVHVRGEGHGRRLTRPVYWLGAWQFASLGYYAEPDYREGRCLRGEPLTGAMTGILERLRGVLRDAHGEHTVPGLGLLPNTCLINYYGRDVSGRVPVDQARLRMHRDGEPGPVVMFNIGQAGLLEFLDPARSKEPELRLWTRHRSVTILSGPEFKDRLYHRISQVRTGAEPRLTSPVTDFEVRRVSVSFRHVPEELIESYGDWPAERQDTVREYVEELAAHSGHYRAQLESAVGAEG